MNAIFKITGWISGILMWIGGISLFSMMAITVLDVFGRMFGYPIFGTYEFITFGLAIATSAALADTHADRRHIGVEILTNALSPRVRSIIDLITGIAALVLFCVVAWQLFLLGASLRRAGEVTMNLRLPAYPMTYIVAIGFLIFIIIVVRRILESINEIRES